MSKEIIKLIREGISINKISKRLGAPKSTIYYHYKKIKGRKYPLLSFEIRATEKEGEIVGIFAGDGSQYFEPKRYHYEISIHFGKKNKHYALYVKELYAGYFGKKFELKEEKTTLRLKTSSKKIFLYFKEYLDYDSKIKHSTVRLNSFNFPREFKIGFLRGLFDTDGSILYKKKEKRVRVSYCTTSKVLALQVKKLLDEFNIKFCFFTSRRKPYKDLYAFYILEESTDTFLYTVEPFKFICLRADSLIW